jgi:3-phenylpropionate/trans-cinnamate dioxygenase ferredoxin subunit
MARAAHGRSRLSAVRRVVVGRTDDVAPGTMQMVQVEGTDILVVNLEGRFHAMQGICSHEYFELDKGFITGDSITCALHLSRFDIESGEALDPPAELPLAIYPVVIDEGQIVLELADGPIPVNE